MLVHKISLHNFRNYERLDVDFGESVNILHGDNAQGKTNLLESIYFCATGHSLRAGADRELIRFGCEDAHIRLLTGNGRGGGHKIDVHLKKDAPKGIAIDGAPIGKLSELFGVLLAVAFSPEDLLLVKAGPAGRRRFIDMELCQLSRVYCHDLQQYHRALKQRNNLLKSVRQGKMPRDTLPLWDDQLVIHGVSLMRRRQAFIDEMSVYAGEIHSRVTNGREQLEIVYKPNVTEDVFAERLSAGTDRDIALGSTGVGAHKDDLSFLINGVCARSYGSQGQQRTASLSAKLAEIEIIKARKGLMPVLLLDDVLSELDETRQSLLMRSIDGGQTIVTTTGLESVAGRVPSQYRTYKVQNGVLI